MPPFRNRLFFDEEKEPKRPEPTENHKLYILWHGTKEDPDFTEFFVQHNDGCQVWRESKGHPQGGYLDTDCSVYWLVDEGCGTFDCFDLNDPQWRDPILEKCEPGRAYTWEFEHEIGRDKDWESGIEEAWVEPTKLVGDPVLVNPELIKCPICDGECRHEVGTDPSGQTHWVDCSFCEAKGEISIDQALIATGEELAGLLGFAESQVEDKNFKASCQISLVRFRELRDMKEELNAQRDSQIR